MAGKDGMGEMSEAELQKRFAEEPSSKTEEGQKIEEEMDRALQDAAEELAAEKVQSEAEEESVASNLPDVDQKNTFLGEN